MPQGVIATLPKFQFSNALGLPMSGGTLTSYLAGTTTPVATYQDEALSAANTNPIALDSRGECTLWLDSTKTYKFVLKNALGVVQWTVDNITNSTAFAQAVRGELDAYKAALLASGGASLVGYMPDWFGAAATTVKKKLMESLSVGDFDNSLSVAASAIGVARTTVDVSRLCVVTSNLTLPVNMILNFKSEGQIQVNEGVTLTINGVFSSGLTQIFKHVGTGKVVFGQTSVLEVYSEWWGAFNSYAPSTYAGADSYQAFTDMSVSLKHSQVIVNAVRTITAIFSGVYKTSNSVAFYGNTILRGASNAVWASSPKIVFHGPDSAAPTFFLVGLNPANGSCRVSGIHFTNTSSSGGAFALHVPKVWEGVTQSYNSIYIDDCHVGGFAGQQRLIYVEKGDDISIHGNVFDVSAGSALAGTITLGDVSNIRIVNNDFYMCSFGILLNGKFTNLSISSNTFYSNNYGIYIVNNDTSSASIVGNCFYGGDTIANQAIGYETLSTCLITANGNTYTKIGSAHYFVTPNSALHVASNGEAIVESTMLFNAESVIAASVKISSPVCVGSNLFPNAPGDTCIFKSVMKLDDDYAQEASAYSPLKYVDKKAVYGTSTTATASNSIPLFIFTKIPNNVAFSFNINTTVTIVKSGVGVYSGSATHLVSVNRNNAVFSASAVLLSSSYATQISSVNINVADSTSSLIMYGEVTSSLTGFDVQMGATISNVLCYSGDIGVKNA